MHSRKTSERQMSDKKNMYERGKKKNEKNWIKYRILTSHHPLPRQEDLMSVYKTKREQFFWKMKSHFYYVFFVCIVSNDGFYIFTEEEPKFNLEIEKSIVFDV